MTELVYLPSFARDLEDIWLAIAGDDETAADRVVSRLQARCLVLRQQPDAGPPRADIAAD